MDYHDITVKRDGGIIEVILSRPGALTPSR